MCGHQQVLEKEREREKERKKERESIKKKLVAEMRHIIHILALIYITIRNIRYEKQKQKHIHELKHTFNFVQS